LLLRGLAFSLWKQVENLNSRFGTRVVTYQLII